RLALEVAVIHALARRLVAMLEVRDPLSERVHLKGSGVAAVGLVGLFNGTLGRLGRMFSASHNPRHAWGTRGGAVRPPTPAHRASGSSFYAARRILPQAQRDAMYEIYSFCRRVDDIADSNGERPQRLAELNAWRAQINALYGGKVGPLVTGLAHPVKA